MIPSELEIVVLRGRRPSRWDGRSDSALLNTTKAFPRTCIACSACSATLSIRALLFYAAIGVMDTVSC